MRPISGKLFVAGMLARHYLRGAVRRDLSAVRNRARDEMMADPPLRFIDSADEPPVEKSVGL